MSATRKIIIFIVGPTAIGKTRIAIKLARRIKGEIVSADSMQIYKNMPILSQAPSMKERQGVKHHLIAAIDPGDECNVASFRKGAASAIDKIIKRKKVPIVVGGSGLYIKALIDGLFPSPEADLDFRKKMENFAGKYGSIKLHDKLAKIDRESAKNIHPNDLKRIIRALEIYDATGRTMTELKAETKGLKDKYRIAIIGLKKAREKMYEAINFRVDKMFVDGAIDEVIRLRTKTLSRTAGAVLGFKEISVYLEGECDIDTAKDALKMNTRRFAKRQLTWFRAIRRIKWISVNKLSNGDVVRKIVSAYQAVGHP